MAVRAKFLCQSVTKIKSWPGVKEGEPFLYNSEFNVVSVGSPENKEFFASTPSGQISIKSTGDLFEPGKEYYIDFTLAE